MGPLIQESLWLLNVCSINPLHKSKLSRFMAVVAIILYSVFAAEIFFTLIFNWNGLDSSDVVGEFVVNYQIIIKISIVLIHRKKLANLLHTIDVYFWPLDKFGSKLEKTVLKGYAQMRKIFICTFSVGLLSIVAFCTKPLSSNQRMLPYPFYHPTDLNRSYIYIAVYAFQVILVLTVALPGLIGIDFLFVSIITYIVNELRMLKKGFSYIRMDVTLSESEELAEIIPLINHHATILRCIKDLNIIFSTGLLTEIVASTFSICAAMLGVIGDGNDIPDIEQVIKPVPALITFLSLLLLHCAAGTLLTTETHSVADAAYDSKWWMKTQPNVRRALTLVIQRAQKTERLSAGGILDVDLLTFTNVVKTAFSYTMLAQALFGKTNVEL